MDVALYIEKHKILLKKNLNIIAHRNIAEKNMFSDKNTGMKMKKACVKISTMLVYWQY